MLRYPGVSYQLAKILSKALLVFNHSFRLPMVCLYTY